MGNMEIQNQYNYIYKIISLPDFGRLLLFFF